MSGAPFDQLRWGMSRAALRVVYPTARTTPLVDSRDPRSGKRVIVGGDELVPMICEVAGVPINATIGFEDDALAQVDLWPDLPSGIADDVLLLAVRRLARQFGREGLVEIPQQAQWLWDDVIVTLTNENGFQFELIRR